MTYLGPPELTINETGEFLLFCNYTSNPNTLTEVRWLRNGVAIDLNQSRVDVVNTDQPSLLIKDARREDKGNYTCVLNNMIGPGESESNASIDVQCKSLINLQQPLRDSHS